MRSTSEPAAKMGGPQLDALDEIDENTLGPANETAAMRAKRMRSIRIAHVGMFIFGLGFSIVITGVYPYMIQLFPDEPNSKLLNQYGYVVSVNPLGQGRGRFNRYLEFRVQIGDTFEEKISTRALLGPKLGLAMDCVKLGN